uniref:Uncharacterized protein n=1 Tax=Timema douglasi TaxID=61478 RepID=A0A7R8VRM5_TIMDO|nr:unnamed protein product [Timema douglasi]
MLAFSAYLAEPRSGPEPCVECAGGVCLPARRSYIKLNEPVVTTQKSWVDAMILILSTRLQSLLSEQALRNLKRSHFRNRVIVLR